MNAFEEAQISLMEKMYALELESVTQVYVALTQTEATILFSLIFGYLLVAHFVGADLTSPQVLILNILYTVTVGSELVVYADHYESIVFSVNRMLELGSLNLSDIPITGTPGSVGAVLLVYAMMIVASLYFMWTVRNPKHGNSQSS